MGSKRLVLIGLAILLTGQFIWQTLKFFELVPKGPPLIVSGPFSMLALIAIILLSRKAPAP